MDDKAILRRVNELVEQEDAMREPGHALSSDEQRRLEAVEAELDQCYDLLRQRRAKREYGESPDTATQRPVEQVEHYVGEDEGPPR